MEYIPAPALINLIVSKLLTEDDKETLRLNLGSREITVEEELTKLYGRMGVLYKTLEEAEIYAARLIHKNRHNLKKLKKVNELATLLEDPINFGNRTITTPDLLQVVNEFRGFKQDTKSNSVSSLKNRSGSSDESEESDIFQNGNKEDGDLIGVIAKQTGNSLEITAEKDEQGKLTTTINKGEEKGTEASEAVEPEIKGVHMHSINLVANRGVTFNNSSNNSVTGINRSSQTKGVTEVLNIVKSDAFNEYLNAQIIDIRSRYIDQFRRLFTPVRYRTRIE